MKVLYSCLSQSWGGMEMFTVDAVLRLLERGIHTELLCFPQSKIEMKAKEESIITHTVQASGYFEPRGINRIKKILSVGNFDLVHTQASKDLWTIVPALVLSRQNIPLILTKQMGSWVVKKDLLHKALYSRVDAAFAISNVIAKNLLETTPISKEKIFVLHNGVDISRFKFNAEGRKEVREKLGVSEKTILIGMLARFTPGKGHEEFIYAAEKLSEKYKDVIFMVIGEPSRGEKEYAEKIYKLADKLIKRERIIFTGFRRDIPEVLSALDVFAFPSHAEAFGIALAEAMACGKACVATASDGPLDLIENEVNGLLFKRGNKEEFAQKIERLIHSPKERDELEKNARTKAMEYFNIEKLTDKTVKIYSELIENKGSRKI